MNIHWYPGHMAKTKRLIKEELKLVDIVIELLDARIPESSRNPDLPQIASGKPRLILFNKIDLSDSNINSMWKRHYENKGEKILLTNAITGSGLKEVFSECQSILKEKIDRFRDRGIINRPIRAMIVGIPNVGKSSLINKLTGKSKAKVEDRPGVTRGNQWIRLRKDFELLDTPGILWPKFDDETVAMNLAFTGAIKDQIIDIESLGFNLTSLLINEYPRLLSERYGIEIAETNIETYDAIGRKRGFLVRGGGIDYHRLATTIIDEFRGGLIGRISLEKPKC